MLITLVDFGIEALWFLLIVHAVLSWVRPDPRNPLVKLVNAVVEPLLLPIRAILPPMGPIDASPMVALLILVILQQLLHRALSGGL